MGGAGVGTGYDTRGEPRAHRRREGQQHDHAARRRPGDARRAEQRAAGRSPSGTRLGIPRHDQHRSAPPLPVRARRERHARGSSRSGRRRSASPRSATRRWCGGSATSRGRSIAPSASRWRCRRRPTSRRSRGGAASTAPSARTPTSPAGWCARTSRDSSTARNGVDTGGVLTVVKHWVGYGAAKEGFDSHSYYGRFATFPGRNLEYHVRPFLGAFAANVGGVMPTYSILEGATLARPADRAGRRGVQPTAPHRHAARAVRLSRRRSSPTGRSRTTAARGAATACRRASGRRSPTSACRGAWRSCRSARGS